MRRLPPLGALRAFEAGARHLNFTRAAAELCVTQAAISHQVRLLEDWLGVRLFERHGHSLRLTAQGAAYLPELTAALDRMAAATARLGQQDGKPLRITVLPSFAACWLVPRLGRFRERHPGIELRLTSSADLWDFADDRFDLGIRSGLGRWAGLKADLVGRETLSPVCSPSVAAGPPALRSPADLQQARLLHDTPKDAWSRWFDHAGLAGAKAEAALTFNDAGLMLRAAVDGHGVALGRLMLAADDLAAGRLVRPFDIALANDYSYWLVYPAARLRPDMAVFRSWLLAEAGTSASP
ncbi:MAG: transcriptional regulator GcvA [Rhizobiales bacterium]|nr:transcriptional regulator GcvA [Hyphomicrobiales bacterium]